MSIILIIIILTICEQVRPMFTFINMYRGADKSLARPVRKQANVSVRIAWISFGALPCRKKKLDDSVSMLLKSRASLKCFRACFLPCRAKDLSAPRYLFSSENLVIQIYLILRNNPTVLQWADNKCRSFLYPFTLRCRLLPGAESDQRATKNVLPFDMLLYLTFLLTL